MTDDREYFEYLRRRSGLGLLYRRAWLYPKLCRYLHGRVLDIGCGIGDMLRHRPGTIGVDVNARNVEWCRKHGLDARAMALDDLPFEDREFDGAVLDNVLEHLAEPRPLLAETRRVLKSGGVVVVGVPGKRGYASDPDHKIFYHADALRAVMQRSGFHHETTFGMPLPFPVLDRHMPQYCLYGVFRSE